MYLEPTPSRTFIGRLKHNNDLLEALTTFCKEQNIRLGTFNVIGAVKGAKLGYYNQERQKYDGCVELDKKLEIASCLGNISLKDNEIMVHAHIVLADFEGQAFGGHLMPGSKIFAAEFHIQEYIGAELHRGKDQETGLPLWKI
ncbi:DNA-binding protein [Candidatus Saganbacteria bacterium CG08_land_8_20_14_0_20_45_16]|uniref:DNA-binding protein n=1 Tax=Candidatus Saganbacteria bacterium CG08_land_8_20_14_0_20_45_16 TaxID=2014293 RepID=A0A2H0Y046_UNCSA|nr:MAG: DNA-binding protein [Candidatus Saganbacteria bacterium CG08_land_8_20_14_0_20_45_16]